jgi:hypothetical protein
MRRRCVFCADIAAKVENRTTEKISRKLIFGLPCCCVAFQRHCGGPRSILDETIWSLTSPRVERISGSKKFRRLPKKTFATISAMTAGISSPINFAVFKLITNRNWVGCCIGSSAGFAPLKSYRHGQRRCERLPTRPGHTTSMPQREGNRRREPSWRVYLRRQIQQFAFARCRILRSARPQLRRNLQPQLLRLHVSVDPAPEPRML